jgi:hypothetical protein
MMRVTVVLSIVLLVAVMLLRSRGFWQWQARFCSSGLRPQGQRREQNRDSCKNQSLHTPSNAFLNSLLYMTKLMPSFGISG